MERVSVSLSLLASRRSSRLNARVWRDAPCALIAMKVSDSVTMARRIVAFALSGCPIWSSSTSTAIALSAVPVAHSG